MPIDKSLAKSPAKSLAATAATVAIFTTLSGCAFLQKFMNKGGATVTIKPGTPILQFKSPAFYVHTEPGGFRAWRVRGSGPASETHRYSGRISAKDGKMDNLEVADLASKGGKVRLEGNFIEFDFTAPGGVSGTAAAGFKWENGKGTCHNVQLFIDGRPARGSDIVVGFDSETHPSSGTFTVCREE